MSEPSVGDYVRFKLPSGVPGTCLLVEEGESVMHGTRMFYGHSEDKREGLTAVFLYESDITEVLVNGPVRCWGCGYGWVAIRPTETDVLECPSCGEMMGAEDQGGEAMR